MSRTDGYTTTFRGRNPGSQRKRLAQGLTVSSQQELGASQALWLPDLLLYLCKKVLTDDLLWGGGPELGAGTGTGWNSLPRAAGLPPCFSAHQQPPGACPTRREIPGSALSREHPVSRILTASGFQRKTPNLPNGGRDEAMVVRLFLRLFLFPLWPSSSPLHHSFQSWEGGNDQTGVVSRATVERTLP